MSIVTVVRAFEISELSAARDAGVALGIAAKSNVMLLPAMDAAGSGWSLTETDATPDEQTPAVEMRKE